MNSIPASQIVNVIPSVLGAGGNPLSLNAVFMTEDSSIPIGTVQGFAALEDVQNWFGANSPEAVLAAVYFSGFNGANTLPSTLYFAQYNVADIGGYLRSGSFASVPLATLQGFSGTLIVPIDGETVTTPNIDLSTATSFSNAAALVQAGLQTTGSIFTGTGTVTNGSPNLTINTVGSGAVHVGDTVVGTDIPAATTILSQTSGSPGGIGVYVMSADATGAAGPEAITITSTATVSYDSLRSAFVIHSPTTGADSSVGFATGSLAANLKLTSATGAVLSPGAVAATPASAMNGVVDVTQNWATFLTVFEPAVDVKLGFAAWVSTQSPAGQERFVYVAWDSDVTPSEGAAPDSFGAEVIAAQYNGVVPVWDLSSGKKAALACGIAASIDFTETQGRTTWAFRGQAGLVADVTDATTAANLRGNGYNYYAAFATANDSFIEFQPGSMPGVWKWIDPYVNQIWMNSEFQLALMELLQQRKSIPYNNTGYALLRAALLDPINAALNFGAIQPGVTLSASQAQSVNTDAGIKIDGVLSTVGWYLQIQPASAQTRGNRTSPPMTFWYTDGGSIQQIELASIDIE